MLVGKPKITGQKYVWFVWAYQCFLCTDTVLYDTTTARSVSQTDLQLSVLRLYERWSPRGVKKMLFRLRLANKSHAPNLFSLLLISRDPFTASRDLCQWSLEAINTDPGHRLILWWDPSPPPLPAIRCLPLCTLLSVLKDFMDQWLHPSTHRWRSL